MVPVKVLTSSSSGVLVCLRSALFWLDDLAPNKIEELAVGFNIAKHTIQAVVLIIGVMIVTQVALAQATPPPRPTPTRSDQSTPVRSTPTAMGTPISNETPMRSTPTPLGTPVSNETPMRPTPTASDVPPPQATPTEHRKPESNPPEATPIATPNLLPVTGAAPYDDAPGPESLLVLAGLGTICWGLGVSARRWRQHHHN